MFASSVNATTSGSAYYYKDGAWVATKAASGYRFLIPEHFEGYIYVPFTTYAGWSASDNKFMNQKDSKNCGFILAITTYCNSVDENDEIFYDNFYIVK